MNCSCAHPRGHFTEKLGGKPLLRHVYRIRQFSSRYGVSRPVLGGFTSFSQLNWCQFNCYAPCRYPLLLIFRCYIIYMNIIQYNIIEQDDENARGKKTGIRFVCFFFLPNNGQQPASTCFFFLLLLKIFTVFDRFVIIPLVFPLQGVYVWEIRYPWSCRVRTVGLQKKDVILAAE